MCFRVHTVYLSVRPGANAVYIIFERAPWRRNSRFGTLFGDVKLMTCTRFVDRRSAADGRRGGGGGVGRGAEECPENTRNKTRRNIARKNIAYKSSTRGKGNEEKTEIGISNKIFTNERERVAGLHDPNVVVVHVVPKTAAESDGWPGNSWPSGDPSRTRETPMCVAVRSELFPKIGVFRDVRTNRYGRVRFLQWRTCGRGGAKWAFAPPWAV